jgi:hypothetical protein
MHAGLFCALLLKCGRKNEGVAEEEFLRKSFAEILPHCTWATPLWQRPHINYIGLTTFLSVIFISILFIIFFA